MQKSSLVILVLMICFIIAQILVGEKYAEVYIPLLWLVLNVVPVIYLIAIRQLPVRNAYLLGFALLLLITPFLQRMARDLQDMDPGIFLMVSCGWLIPAQVLLWLSGRNAAAAGLQERSIGLDGDLLNRIRNELVPANRTDAALTLMKGIPGLHPEEEKQLALISARNAALSSNLISNLIDADAAGREQAHVNSAILTLTSQLLATMPE